MAPPKPSVQTQFVLSKMEEREKRDDERWEHVMENLDLLFSKVGEIAQNQQKGDTRYDATAQVIEQILKDQQRLAKQIEANGQAVARLTLESKEKHNRRPSSPTSSDTSVETRAPQFQNKGWQGKQVKFYSQSQGKWREVESQEHDS